MILVINKFTLEVERTHLYVEFRRWSLFAAPRSGMPFFHFSRERSEVGTAMWGFGLRFAMGSESPKSGTPKWTDRS